MIAMVLAAGLGTRLRPLTERIAKPALPLLGTTLLGNVLEQLSRAGVEEVVVNAHHLPETVASVAREQAERLGLLLHLSFEAPDVLGTGGALVAARPLLEDAPAFLLINGDVLTDLDLRQALAAHQAGGSEATMVLRPMPAGADYGPVEVNEAGQVVRIAGHGREPVPGEATRTLLFAGVHVLGPSIFEVLPREGACCINRQGHAALIRRGGTVGAFVHEGGSWSDVGTPERYLEANLDLLDRRYDLPASIFGEAVERSPGVWVHPTARVEPGATLEAPVFIGSGATVHAAARVGPRAVVLEQSECAGTLREGVLAPFGSLGEGETGTGRLVG